MKGGLNVGNDGIGRGGQRVKGWDVQQRGRGHLCWPITARIRVTQSCHICGDEGGASDLRSVQKKERKRVHVNESQEDINEYLRGR